MTNGLIAVLVVALAGVVLLLGSSNTLLRARKLKSSVFNSGRYSLSQFQEAELSVLQNDELPSDPHLRALTLEWAREEAELGPRGLRWQPFQCLGAAMILSVLYLIPIFGTVIGISAQAILIAVGTLALFVGIRGVRRARRLIERYDEQP
jgi:Flp pilus assembly protein TadB